ncbi:hypothetical protein H5410_040090, partial [Solanum commersonii]
GQQSLFQIWGKSYDITESRSKVEVWYDWVENARHHKRRMVLSRGALGIRGKTAKSWRCRDFSTNFFIALKFNQYGRYLYLISVKGSDRIFLVIKQKNNRAVIILPESAFNEGWERNDTPIRNDVRRWAQQTWNGAHGVQIYDMNGILFLFKFQSRKTTEHVLMGDWKRQGSRLKLQWWSPTIGAFPITHEFEWFWIRVLGLHLHLWSRPIMKEIGDRCGGWIETEEETDLKNHLRWTRIRVKGPAKFFLASIEIIDEENIFSLPIWVELSVTFHKKYDEGACTSKERHEDGYRGRNPSNLSRCRDIHRSEKLPVKPNREEKVFFGERRHVGGKVTEGTTSEQIEGHLVLNPGPSGLVKSPIFKRPHNRT